MFKKIIFYFVILANFLLPNFSFAADQALSSLSYKVLSAAQEQLDNGQHVEAIKTIRPLLKKIQDKPYDQAVAYQTLGFAFYAANDSKNAKAAFIKAASLNSLPADIQQKLLFNVTKILTLDEDYKTANTYLKKWMDTKPKMDSDGHILAAMIYYNLEQYKAMVPHLKSAISLNKNAPLNWRELLASAYIQLKQYKNAAAVYEQLVRIKPNQKQLWIQLATIYQLANNSKKALAVTELAYKNNLLDENEIFDLANNYLYHNMPYKAGNLLSSNLANNNIKANRSNLELLANSWILAQETDKAISALKTLSEVSNDTEISFRLGQMYYENNQWQEAVNTLKPVVKDKNFESRSKALLILGISAYEINDIALSENAFSKAMAYKETKDNARQWLRQIENKKPNSNKDT